MNLHEEEYGAAAKKAVTMATVVAVILVLAKAYAWYMSGSASVLSSLVDSSLDSVSSLMTLVILRYSLQPPDEDHHFGHGKAESLAALGQAIITALAGLVIIVEALRRVFSNHELSHSKLGVSVMVLSIVMTLALVLYQRHIIRKTNSMAVKADNLHYVSDLLANAGVIAALLLETSGVPYADAVGGVIVAVFILRAANEIFRESLRVLLDEQLPDDVMQRFQELLSEDERILGFHDVKTRMDGKSYFFQVHIEVSGEFKLSLAHDVAEDLEKRVEKEWPSSSIIVHLDPA